MKDETLYLLTDGCMWELNKQTGTEHPHAVEVVDIKTGAVRYIRSGSLVKFVEGEITDIRTQKAYNTQTKDVLCGGQDMPERKKRETKGKGDK